jgi:hypothetical protein
VITIIKIASNASSVFDKSWYARKAKATNEGASLHPLFIGSKTKTSDEKRGSPKTQGAQKQIPPMKKRQPQNARGSKERPPMKKEATLKRKGLKKKDLR